MVPRLRVQPVKVLAQPMRLVETAFRVEDISLLVERHMFNVLTGLCGCVRHLQRILPENLRYQLTSGMHCAHSA